MSYHHLNMLDRARVQTLRSLGDLTIRRIKSEVLFSLCFYCNYFIFYIFLVIFIT